MSNFLSQGSNQNESGDSHKIDVSPEFLKLLEATVLSAGNYVVPSDDLRPHTLEAAHEIDSNRRGSSRFVGYSVAIVLCACLCFPIADRLSPWREKVSGRTSLQIQEMALKKNIGPDWGLLEVFTERQQQAARHRAVISRKIEE